MYNLFGLHVLAWNLIHLCIPFVAKEFLVRSNRRIILLSAAVSVLLLLGYAGLLPFFSLWIHEGEALSIFIFRLIEERVLEGFSPAALNIINIILLLLMDRLLVEVAVGVFGRASVLEDGLLGPMDESVLFTGRKL